MKDWSNYIEREIVEVLPDLETLGFHVTSDEKGIGCYRNIKMQKGEEFIELVCLPLELEEYDSGSMTTDEVHWFVDDIFEDDESYQEKNNYLC